MSARPLAGDPGQVVVELEFPREGIRHHETIPLASYRMTLDAFVRIAAAGRHIDRIEVLDEVDLGHPPPAEARPPADSARGPIEIPPAAPRLP